MNQEFLRQMEMEDAERGFQPIEIDTTYIAIPSFTAHALPPYGMSGSFFTLALFRSCMPNAQHKTGRQTGYSRLGKGGNKQALLSSLLTSDVARFSR